MRGGDVDLVVRQGGVEAHSVTPAAGAA
jgi:hypothetical protein